MIQLYTWSTPNGRKVSIMLEEIALPYTAIPVDIIKGDQFKSEFLSINPNNKIPAIVDTETGQTVFESGAILLYLANKAGQLMPEKEGDKWKVIQWLMWQMGGQGPMLGQAHHFIHYNPGKSEYAEQRYSKEAKRLYSVLDQQLSLSSYIAVDELTIADIAIWPWVSRYHYQQIDLHGYPKVLDWYLKLADRPGFQKGYRVPHIDDGIPLPER